MEKIDQECPIWDFNYGFSFIGIKTPRLGGRNYDNWQHYIGFFILHPHGNHKWLRWGSYFSGWKLNKNMYIGKLTSYYPVGH